jgi:hypothetical protein
MMRKSSLGTDRDLKVFSGRCVHGTEPAEATGRNQVHILQRVNSDCQTVDATIGNAARNIRHDFPHSLLLSEIRMVAWHISPAFHEERNGARELDQ